MKRVRLNRLAFIGLVCAVIIIDLPQSITLKSPFTFFRFEKTFTRPEIHVNAGSWEFERDLEVKYGLDLQGGTEVILRADMSGIESVNRTQALESAEAVLRRRVDLFGVSEPLIQRAVQGEDYRLIVQLPGIKNVDAALKLIGQTAQLDFRELSPEVSEATDSANLLTDFVPTGLTGKDLARAQVQFDTQGVSGAQVGLEFNEEGKKLFGEITSQNVGKPVAIFLDELPLMTPTVNEPIVDGRAVITGSFTTEEAKNLAIQLNAGALPAPIEIIQQRTVGATLGADSVTRSLKAGAVGLSIVMLFMASYYGTLGIVADAGLILYGLITLAIYKLVPVTLTLPGLAGFLLSMGMAVDSNILVFERFKEELRLGKPWQAGLELAFGRAWDSIKDANLATLATAFVLFNPLNWNFLPQSGLVRGFALTLSLGVLTSLFTGVVITRALLRTFYRGRNKEEGISVQSFRKLRN